MPGRARQRLPRQISQASIRTRRADPQRPRAFPAPCSVPPQANTQQIHYANRGFAHTEGGWPKDVDPTEVEHVLRYRKKIEKDEEYVATIAALGAEVEDLIKQNNAIDIYEEYFAGSQADHSSEQPYAKTLTVFRDPSEIKRSASYISWNPDVDNRKCAVAYSILGFRNSPRG